jgi:hypothetical protein
VQTRSEQAVSTNDGCEQECLASLWQVKLAGREKSVPMTAERARRFGESMASQTGGKEKSIPMTEERARKFGESMASQTGGKEKSVPMTEGAERARKFGESLVSQTGGKGKVSTNGGRKRSTIKRKQGWKSPYQTSPWQTKIIIGLRATRHGLSGKVLTMGNLSFILSKALQQTK